MDKKKLLIVDDESSNLQVLRGILKEEYVLFFAKNGQKAIELAENFPPDLILLDIMMPEMDGFEVCLKLKQNPRLMNIPVIFVTALGEEHDEARGFKVGAVDYITKPVSSAIVKARVRNHLFLYDRNCMLKKLVMEKTQELNCTQDATIFSLATLAEYRDNETGGHIVRTKGYVHALLTRLHSTKYYSDRLNEEVIELIVKSAPLHDIGKVGVPDALLLKPGPLTDEEFEEIKKHTTYGYEAILKAEEHMGADKKASFLRFAREIALTHQEKWDGSGYPQGLKGDAIPLAGRVMAVADVYDALISKRIYKPPFSHNKAVRIIQEGRGTHFDPVLVDIFLEVKSQFREIALSYLDFEEERETLLL